MNDFQECDAYALQRRNVWGETDLELPFSSLKASQINDFLRQANLPTFMDTLNYTVNAYKTTENELQDQANDLDDDNGFRIRTG